MNYLDEKVFGHLTQVYFDIIIIFFIFKHLAEANALSCLIDTMNRTNIQAIVSDRSFLGGLKENRISTIESDIEVKDIVHSPTTDTIYVSNVGDVSGYKWDVKKKTFTHLFTCKPTGSYIRSLVLAPLHTNGTDQLSQPYRSSEITNTRRTPEEGNREINQKGTE